MQTADSSPPTWDICCRVIDNYGDLGVCLRLARDLARRGTRARLWCDDLSPLAWMQPDPVERLEIRPWEQAEAAAPGDVVIETFGCEPPAAFVAAMAAKAVRPAWINLEYLSAEDYVERSHGLKSPQFSGPGAGLDKWFFYPGFNERTGGLIREPGLIDAVTAHHGDAWRAARGWGRLPGERVLSLFAYPQAPLAPLLEALGPGWLLLLCPGAPQAAVPPLLREGQRAIALPALTQDDYDRLLWSCDLNLVRGEDSFVRAQWAGQPMLWQIYFQDDGAHGPKLEAFLDAALAGAEDRWAANWRALSRAWNGLGPWTPACAEALRERPAAVAQARAWRAKLAAQVDLTSQLQAFAARAGGA
ncbi:elongation factor P maturation arginine rhamnosyltransferase EarP [Mitsuaria sp. GD03876]|uniref:elongation factor P maturation arginine rhamnosyltransferase EarP n=1 Tax=Mitsuaria sp. GD03876 TaxID=2975399 RepID=UPI00244CBDA4|nr:elongation factor P maturation arginine rhamnosyltransferase EarP [Mitsuaria sp. GD03876]MDH0863879.1 elongation factor P maturation arginine rhamnosyltransferase EarP [Mitsuaria sp. GD03876]